MHTIIRDRDTSKNDFVFYADRLIRLVVEAGLGFLPFDEQAVTTPAGVDGGRGSHPWSLVGPARAETRPQVWAEPCHTVLLHPAPRTPHPGVPYVGVDFARKLCGVSIIRSGESTHAGTHAGRHAGRHAHTALYEGWTVSHAMARQWRKPSIGRVLETASCSAIVATVCSATASCNADRSQQRREKLKFTCCIVVLL
eukprot:366092-Chlamydomonas_euryale.AAC.3